MREMPVLVAPYAGDTDCKEQMFISAPFGP